jgi:hypothetical protein
MATLKRASTQLFTRPDDERFPTLDALEDHCRQVRESSDERWQLPGSIRPEQCHDQLGLEISDVGQFRLNDWSFGQVCGLADVQKETINRLLPATAARVLTETLPVGTKPVQVLTQGDRVRSIHGASYTRLFDSDLLDVVRNTADGFGPPPKGFDGATGLYAGQQDMFAFLIDDSAWVDIGGEQFAPGFFVWNSEVGRRTVKRARLPTRNSPHFGRGQKSRSEKAHNSRLPWERGALTQRRKAAMPWRCGVANYLTGKGGIRLNLGAHFI